MKQNVVSRLTAMCVIGLIGAFLVRQNIHNEVQEGRDAFLAAQAARFDRQVKTDSENRHKVAVPVVVGLGGGVLIFGIYELVVAGVGVIVKRYQPLQ
jgi:hypothetical protein